MNNLDNLWKQARMQMSLPAALPEQLIQLMRSGFAMGAMIAAGEVVKKNPSRETAEWCVRTAIEAQQIQEDAQARTKPSGA